MKTRQKRKPRNIYNGVIRAIPDVRELQMREKRMNTRKGMSKVLIVPQGMTGEQLKIWQDNEEKKTENRPQRVANDDLEPNYIKKYKSIMI